MCVSRGVRIELRALGKISVGEELTVSYVDFLNVSKDRQHLLKQRYYFDCKCEHCTHATKDQLMNAIKDKVCVIHHQQCKTHPHIFSLHECIMSVLLINAECI